MEFNNSIHLIKQTNFITFEQQDINDFVNQAKEEHKLWHENLMEITVNTIESFNSKYITCSF